MSSYEVRELGFQKKSASLRAATTSVTVVYKVLVAQAPQRNLYNKADFGIQIL